MKKILYFLYLFSGAMALVSMSSCNPDDNFPQPQPQVYGQASVNLGNGITLGIGYGDPTYGSNWYQNPNYGSLYQTPVVGSPYATTAIVVAMPSDQYHVPVIYYNGQVQVVACPDGGGAWQDLQNKVMTCGQATVIVEPYTIVNYYSTSGYPIQTQGYLSAVFR